MSASNAAKAMKGMVAELGKPPRPEEIVGTLQSDEPKVSMQRAEEASVQLNLRVPASVKHRVRVLAARDDLTLSELVTRALDLYEQQYGKASR